jgi:CarD family transcriptional regulator
MFKVNDYVVYSSMGVFKIMDIREDKDVNSNEIEYYILEPAYSNNLIIKTPVNNEKALMREIISKDGILSLISAMPEKETIWIDDYRQRIVNFKALLKTGDCEELIKLIKTLYLEQKEKSVIGKKLMKSDEDIMKAAEKHLNEEFAIALNISPDEVVPYIREHI